jgi:hypothetical protein
VKVEPEEANAVRVMDVPDVIDDCEQVEPQDIEPPVTVPEPVPDLETVNEYVVTPTTEVVKVLFPDVVRLPDESLDLTR